MVQEKKRHEQNVLAAFPAEKIELLQVSRGKPSRLDFSITSYEDLHEREYLRLADFDLVVLGPYYSEPFGNTSKGNHKFLERLNICWRKGTRVVVLVAGSNFKVDTSSYPMVDPVVRTNYLLASVIHGPHAADMVLRPGFEADPKEKPEFIGELGEAFRQAVEKGVKPPPTYAIQGPNREAGTEVSCSVLPIAVYTNWDAVIAGCIFSKAGGAITILPYGGNGIDLEFLETVIRVHSEIDWEKIADSQRPESPEKRLGELTAVRELPGSRPYGPTLQPEKVAEILGIKLKTLQNRISEIEYPWLKRLSGKRWVAITEKFFSWLKSQPKTRGRKPKHKI